MKKVFLLLFVVFTCSTAVTFAQRNEIVLVIDAGHGGNDPGHETAINGHSDEKALNLKIANYFGGYISKYLKNVRVIYTRTGDKTISLDDRVDIANNASADYFISIHCNGNDRKSVRGTETHVHSMSVKKSVNLGKKIEQQFSARAGRHSRGVKDKEDLAHSLQVLKFTEMTSVLVECGFITNTKEANYLNSTYGQEIIASAIFRAFRSFIQEQHPTMNFVKSSSETVASTSSATGAYTIQIMSSKSALDVNDSSFKRLKMKVSRKKLNTTRAYKYIYTVGNYASRSAAKLELAKIQKQGFRDAIIVKQ
ncbi:MAG: N-acetylmuramoyl-L-alanine amidase [Crocinitomicaceae bacterium]|nr:N-acetylmuramoyl-L-alanine amidase [Crocinitomicaceae bacterium]MDG1657674.1 N-acetylmuramoyl-L-alanine amidase [Crocinitomicaceae bacterium]MDG2441210.1 N-acetylmuramoyl-L-alanine amidase [Crocinitomicaceae bacterium]